MKGFQPDVGLNYFAKVGCNNCRFDLHQASSTLGCEELLQVVAEGRGLIYLLGDEHPSYKTLWSEHPVCHAAQLLMSLTLACGRPLCHRVEVF